MTSLKLRRDFHNFNRGKFNLDLASYVWSEMYEKSSESEIFATFGLIVEKVTSAHAPYRTKTINQKVVTKKNHGLMNH